MKKATNQEPNMSDPVEIAIKKFRWGGHTPFGNDIIGQTEKFLLPLSRSPAVTSILYEGGGAEGRPNGIKLSQKIDIPNHLNLSVIFHRHSIHFIVTLNDKIAINEIPAFILFFEKYYK